MSLIRDNIMTRKNYSPYCGNDECKKMPRSPFNGHQFECRTCGWQSEFPKDFIEKYKDKWKK